MVALFHLRGASAGVGGMIPPLQSLVKYDNATLVSTLKDKLGASKLSKSPGKVNLWLSQEASVALEAV